MMELQEINAIPCATIAAANSLRIYLNQETCVPETFVIDIATDPQKHPAGALTIPVYLPPENNFHSAAHYELLDILHKDPFCAVEFYNLTLHKSKAGNIYGSAQSFCIAELWKLKEVL